MLVLSRKPGEEILIGEGPQKVTVMPVHIGPNSVRLGITAPREVKILRSELAGDEPVNPAEVVTAHGDGTAQETDGRPENLAAMTAGQSEVFHESK